MLSSELLILVELNMKPLLLIAIVFKPKFDHISNECVTLAVYYHDTGLFMNKVLFNVQL